MQSPPKDQKCPACGGTVERRRECARCGDQPGSFAKHCPACLEAVCECGDTGWREEWRQAFSVKKGFRLQRLLDKGGQAFVWWGVRVGSGRPVEAAIKIYKAKRGTSEAKRADSEADILQNCGSPGVPRLHDTGDTADGNPFLVMDYCRYPNLEATIGTMEAFDPEDRTRIRSYGAMTVIQRAAWTLTGVHALGFAHLDLKPSNLLVDADLLRLDIKRRIPGEFGLMVVDWGNGRRIGRDDLDDGDRRDTSVWLKTYSYCPPEYWSVHNNDYARTLTRAADVFALGMTWYRVLTGDVAWPPPAGAEHKDIEFDWRRFLQRCQLRWRGTPDDAMLDGEAFERMEDSINSLPFQPNDVSRVRALLLRCLSYEPKRRPTALDLTAKLQRLIPRKLRPIW